MTGEHNGNYLETLFGVIDRTLRDFYPLPPRIGELTKSELRREYTEHGVYAVAEFGLSGAPGRRFRYRRCVLAADGPDKDPATAAIFYTVSLFEKLISRPLPDHDGSGPLSAE